MSYLELAKLKTKELGLDRNKDMEIQVALGEETEEFSLSGSISGNLLELSLEDFKSSNLAVRIKSKVLSGNIWLVSNEETRDHLKAEGLVCYLADEILHLKGLSPEEIRKIHEVKKVFEMANVVEFSDRGKS